MTDTPSLERSCPDWQRIYHDGRLIAIRCAICNCTTTDLLTIHAVVDTPYVERDLSKWLPDEP